MFFLLCVILIVELMHGQYTLSHSWMDTSGITPFSDVCGECQHIVAHHTHTFWLEDSFQHYEMSCLLCGEAEDARSCLPDDPRFEATLF